MTPTELKPRSSKPSIDVEEIIAAPKKAVSGLLQALRLWDPSQGASVSVQQLSGAMTNLVYRVALVKDGQEQQVFLLRVHASQSELFDRAGEIATFRAVAAAGLGPRLHALFGNGRLEEFLVDHATLSAPDMRQPDISCAIGATLARFHLILSQALLSSHHHADPVLCWGRLRAWAALAQSCWGAARLAAATGIADLEAEITAVQAALQSSHPVWVACCHNDLQYGNIMALPAPPAPAQATPPPALAAGNTAVPPLQPPPPAAAPPTAAALAAVAAAEGLGQLELSSSPSASSSSGFLLRGRSSSQVQLQDGSLVMPGLRARPRGQSPDSKRPEGGGGGPGGTTPGYVRSRLGESAGDEDGSSHRVEGSRGPAGGGGEEGGRQLQEQTPGAAAAAAGGGGDVRTPSPTPVVVVLPLGYVAAAQQASQRGGGAATITAAAAAGAGEDSDDSDDLLPPTATQPTNWRSRAARISSSGSNRSYQDLRAEMRHPGDGVELPDLGDASDDEQGVTSSSSGLSTGAEEWGGVAAAAAVVLQQQHHHPHREADGVAGVRSSSHNTPAPPPPPAGAAGAGTGQDSSGSPARVLDAVCLIDYEYAGFNPVALDIANHWCEWAADYHTDTPHILDFSRLPGPQQQQLFVEAYLATLLQQAGLQLPPAATAGLPLPVGAVGTPVGAVVGSTGCPAAATTTTTDNTARNSGSRSDPSSDTTAAAATAAAATAAAAAPTDPLALRSLWFWLQTALTPADVAPAAHPLTPGATVSLTAWHKLVTQLMAAGDAYMAVSHLLWALWGYIQAEVSDVDFDFLTYGQQRLQQYLLTRPPALSAAAAVGGATT